MHAYHAHNSRISCPGQLVFGLSGLFHFIL
jgi:hypothetical protein